MSGTKEYNLAYRKANKERLSAQSAARRERWRRDLLEIVGGSKCKDCPESDFRVLVFDHLADKVCNVSHYLDKNWDKALEEARKCDVVCSNCHAKRTYDRRPHPEVIEGEWLILSKTHCPRGYEKIPENRVAIRNTSYCILCRRERYIKKADRSE